MADDGYYMKIAANIASKSNDRNTKVGACIVNKDNKFVGAGYNAMPLYKDSKYPTDKNVDPLESKHTYFCHAELNAILNTVSADLKDCKIYVTRHPCNECAKLIAQSGITEVIYRDNDKPGRWDVTAAERIFKTSGIAIRQVPSS
ncbi:uncharacterized protein CBL_01613 [Carabus blaptoides fortunei]